MPVGDGAIRVTTEEAGSGIAGSARKARVLSTRLPALPRPADLARLVLEEARAQLDRIFVWVPVAFGAGSALYLGLKTEPTLWPSAVLAVILCLIATALAVKGAAQGWRALALLAAMAACGFCVAKLRSDHVAAPIVPAGLGIANVEGWVVDIDTPSDNRPRLVVAPIALGNLPPSALPLRVRIVAPAGGAVAPGTAIRIRSLIDPPPPPAAPGAYDFARDAWFTGEGGVGLATDPPTAITLPTPPWRLSLVMAVNAFRWRVAQRLAADMDQVMGGNAGDAAGLAVAVTTSHQDWLSQATRDDFRAAGLAHMLAIAGLHTAAMSGFVFLALRLLIAAWPWAALRAPGKKIAATGALIAVGAYLVLSGAHPPARRAAVTASVAFLAILLDRRAISLRSLSLAALIILLAEPEAVIQPGFEMSFCATAALVALAEIWPRPAPTVGLAWPLVLLQRSRDAVAALFMVSLVAGAATGPFAIQHFNRIANFGVFANLSADFIASVLMMPALAVALALEVVGHGLATPALFVAGWMARAVVWIAQFFATAPGEGLSMSAAPTLALAASYLGIIFLCLWRGRLRWIGLPLAFAVALWPRPAPPLIWIAADGADAAVVSAGREVVVRPGIRSYATDLWAQRHGLGAPADMARARTALFDCDYWSCAPKPVFRPALGVWWTRRKPHPDRLEALCRNSDILVLRAAVDLPGACSRDRVLTLADFEKGGSAEIYAGRTGWRIVWAQPLRGRRPWTGPPSPSPM